MTRIVLMFLLVTVSWQVFSQTILAERIEVKSGQKVIIDFAYANEVNVRGWDNNYISIEAKVLINMGKNDDSYIIKVGDSGGEKTITGFIKDKDNLPQMIQIKKGGQIYYFETGDWDNPKIKQFYEENGRNGIDWMSHGVAWEIDVEIKVPKDIDLKVISKHGIIDIENFPGAVKANSKHGGVDITIPGNSRNKFNLRTQWGEIYTNLDFNFSEKTFSSKSSSWNKVVCTLDNGSGALIDLESKHGNLYLRKEQ